MQHIKEPHRLFDMCYNHAGLPAHGAPCSDWILSASDVVAKFGLEQSGSSTITLLGNDSHRRQLSFGRASSRKHCICARCTDNGVRDQTPHRIENTLVPQMNTPCTDSNVRKCDAAEDSQPMEPEIGCWHRACGGANIARPHLCVRAWTCRFRCACVFMLGMLG